MMINVKDRELLDLRSKVTQLSPQASSEHVLSSGTNDIMKTVDKIVDLQAVINSEIDKLVDLKNEARQLISKLKDYRYEAVLTAYYINHMTWEQVAVHLGYDERYIFKLHGRALQAFDRILKEDIKRQYEVCYNGSMKE